VDAPVLRWRNNDGDPDLEEVLYYATDANFNVTALVDASDGSVAERVVYDPYGKPAFYDGSWQNPSATSACANAVLFTGHRLDDETGLYHAPRRYYHATLGRWLSRDPAGLGPQGRRAARGGVRRRGPAGAPR
jgi:RHS repeat-associated protein